MVTALADLYVVRDVWARYQAAELAFVENVMPGEDRERSTRTTNRSQTVQESETIDITRSREETYESERTTESEETSTQTDLEVGLQVNNDLNFKYGPVENSTQIGASLSFSRTEAERRATEIARESGRRAVKETEKRVRQLRRQTTETIVSELDAHRLSNTSTDAVRGAYRWVEKIQKYQIFSYPHRLQLEFYLPEPGKFLRRLLSERTAVGATVPVPDPLYLTTDGTEKGKPITVDGITEENYLALAAALKVSEVPPPPEKRLVVTEALSLNGGTRDKERDSWALLPFPPASATTKDVQIPDGYQAISWSASATASPELAKWRDWTELTDTNGDGVDERVGYHSIVAAVTVGSDRVLIRNRVLKQQPDGSVQPELNTVHFGQADYRDRWLAEKATWRDINDIITEQTDFRTPIEGKLSFGATLGGAYNGTISVSFSCVPTPTAIANWKGQVYGTLSAAVQARQLAVANATMANHAQTMDEVRRSLSPSVRKVLITNELKRQVLECILGDHFSGFDDAPDGDDGTLTRPLQNFGAALRDGIFVRFFEQSFEWDNLMHVLYPYYWANSGNWSRQVEFVSTDLELTAFLEAGGARVLVPARPGFESAVYTFFELGHVLAGGNALGGDTRTSLSVADEIMSMTRPPDDGIPGLSWESSVPTAMLWLDTSLNLPLINPALTKKPVAGG